MTACHMLLHLVPLYGVLGLLGLNWSEYYIAPVFTLSTALQFVAKLHELTMQASIVEVMLSIFRTQVMDDYLSFGALSATTQILQTLYLWSLDFFAAITSKCFADGGNGFSSPWFPLSSFLLLWWDLQVRLSCYLALVSRVQPKSSYGAR